MAKFAVINGEVWAELDSLILDMSEELVSFFEAGDVPEERIHTLLDVMEELLDKRDLTLQAHEDRVSHDTEDKVDEAL